MCIYVAINYLSIINMYNLITFKNILQFVCFHFHRKQEEHRNSASILALSVKSFYVRFFLISNFNV